MPDPCYPPAMPAPPDPTHIRDLTPDPENARLHNPRNIGMVVEAMHEVGAARSIVIDEDGVVLAGNGAIEAAAEAGITKVLTVDADGETIVAVRRKGLSVAQKRRLALYDNRTAELAAWDVGALAALREQGVNLDSFWRPDEVVSLLHALPADEVAPPDLPSGDREPFQQMTFTLHDSQAEVVRAAVEQAQSAGLAADVNENRNGNALAAICAAYLQARENG